MLLLIDGMNHSPVSTLSQLTTIRMDSEKKFYSGTTKQNKSNNYQQQNTYWGMQSN
jgi:hypothetical protein